MFEIWNFCHFKIGYNLLYCHNCPCKYLLNVAPRYKHMCVDGDRLICWHQFNKLESDSFVMYCYGPTPMQNEWTLIQSKRSSGKASDFIFSTIKCKLMSNKYLFVIVNAHANLFFANFSIRNSIQKRTSCDLISKAWLREHLNAWFHSIQKLFTRIIELLRIPLCIKTIAKYSKYYYCLIFFHKLISHINHINEQVFQTFH